MEVGDKVICIDHELDHNTHKRAPRFGCIYTVSSHIGNHYGMEFIGIKGSENPEWLITHFKKIKDIPNHKLVAFRLTEDVKYINE